MNKEEFELKLQQFLNNQVYIMAYRFNYDSARIFNDELIEYIKQLQQENKQLQERINKAIEYIKNNGEKQYNIHDNYRGKWYSPDDLDNLLDILKGE